MRNTADLKVITAAALQDAASIVLQSLHTYRKLYFRNTANLSLMMNAVVLKDAAIIVLQSLILMNMSGNITTATGFVARFRLKINASSMIETINAAGTSTITLPAMPIKGGV